MYNNSYGYGVYKRSQVNIGNPYKVMAQQEEREIAEEAYNEAAAAELDEEQELSIGQDIIHKAKEEAALIRREAELEAEKLLSDAKEEIKRLQSETVQKAKEEGYQKGEEIVQQHYSRLISEAEDFKEKCKQEYNDTMASLEKDIVDLILDIASKVVGDEIRNNEQSIVNIVRDTIMASSNHEKIILKVSVDDYDLVKENQDKLISNVGDVVEMDIRKDNTLSKGSCIVETGFGSVDGSVDTRMNDIKQAFYDILGDISQDE